ncbi:class I SAM-dependent methyltransferase [Nocardia sp. R7R-8]|uniref:class I SAM-dependent methyltransferase n=1 Tax=Nocardia sp. R7R-8 TaxID=3459304 RepID=UPI00403DF58D
MTETSEPFVEPTRARQIIGDILCNRRVTTADGVDLELHSNIDAVEGEFLADFIDSRPSVIHVVEIGCAFGLSSLYIAHGLRSRPGARHIIADPFQFSDWHGVGVRNLREAGHDRFELTEQPSELFLPQLVEQSAGEVDLVFVDGWHTFDQTMVDLYFANRLLRVGGYVIVDDCDMPGVAKAVSLLQSYPCYEMCAGSARHGFRGVAGRILGRLGPAAAVMPHALFDHVYNRIRYPSMVALRKTDEDRRDWRWFRTF